MEKLIKTNKNKKHLKKEEEKTKHSYEFQFPQTKFAKIEENLRNYSK